jgi:hypothetical protein
MSLSHFIASLWPVKISPLHETPESDGLRLAVKAARTALRSRGKERLRKRSVFWYGLVPDGPNAD